LSAEKRDLEKDIKDSFMAEKGRDNDLYCQHLYAALCNNDFVPLETMAVLSEEYWSCSWRYAGGIASDIKAGTIDGGHYMEYYCSGLTSDKYDSPKCYAGEGEVREEIREDLSKIGWAVVGNNGYIDKYQ
jgi:hypothetical protein